MDSYLRKIFLNNLTVDIDWSEDEHLPSDSLWGDNYWQNQKWLYYH